MRLYDKLHQRKQNGEKLDIKKITYETLYQLWWQEDITDEMVAKLYDVRKKKVTNLRHKWGIKTQDAIVNEFQSRFLGTIPTEEEDLQSKAVSPDAANLIRKINDLNDIELESLRLELARRFQSLSEVTQEADFLTAVERAIRQFGAKNDHSAATVERHSLREVVHSVRG